MNKKKQKFSKKAIQEQRIIFEAANEIVEDTIECFVHEDRGMVVQIDSLADVIGSLKERIRKNHKRRLARGKCSVELGMALMDMVTSLDRIAKHCSNIAEEELAAMADLYALHQYARTTRENSEAYKDQIRIYREKYSLLED